jgi:hypothetical protein
VTGGRANIFVPVTNLIVGVRSMRRLRADSFAPLTLPRCKSLKYRKMFLDGL